MLQPERFQQDQRVCHLRKSLYGLKQASRISNEKLNESLKNIGLKSRSVYLLRYICYKYYRSGNLRRRYSYFLEQCLEKKSN